MRQRRSSFHARWQPRVTTRPRRSSSGAIAELGRLFTAEVTSFERKRYANLSHAPNKAMNLNSYIALIGGDGSRRTHAARRGHPRGVPAEVRPAISRFPTPTTCSPSTPTACLSPQYCLRLVHFLEQPREQSHDRRRPDPVQRLPQLGHPASSGSPAPPRTSSTCFHQGLTSARGDLLGGGRSPCSGSEPSTTSSPPFVTSARASRRPPTTSRTAPSIEDTESSVDLACTEAGSLFNYPERLSYSRHAAGLRSLVHPAPAGGPTAGCLILPKLLRIILRRSEHPGPIHAFMRSFPLPRLDRWP